MAARGRGRRRNVGDYLSDPQAKIPRTTLYRHKKQNASGRQQINNVGPLLVGDNGRDQSDYVPHFYELLLESNSKQSDDDEASEHFERDDNDVDDEVTSLLESILQVQIEETLFDNDPCDDLSDLDFQSQFDLDEQSSGSPEENLFPGSRLKVQELVLLLLTLATSCSIPFTTLNFIMKIIELVCPKDNKCQTSMRGIHQFIQTLNIPLRKHYYCVKCFLYKGQGTKDDQNVPCPCCKTKSTGHFIDVPMLGELKKIMERLWQYTDYRFKRSTDHDDKAVKDIYDGSVYQGHFNQDGFLRDPNNISLMGFTDGVAIFKSSGFSVWPIYFTINELPPNLRYRRENGVFAGLWYGKDKPNFNTFLKPFVETIWNLYEEGIQVETENGFINSKVLLLQMTCDAPAKCLFQNFKQFNGKYGCPYCLHPGQSCIHEAGSRSRSHIYDYRETDTIEKRTHEMTLEHANKSHQNKLEGKKQFDEFGVKGLSWALCLPQFDIIENVCLDYMHCVLLGVVKQLMMLWFSTQYKTKPWSCMEKLTDTQKRLLKIKPTNSITRVPRSIDDLKHWKASEFRAWILFYGHVCMYEILPNDYYQHFLLLVESIWILLQERIEQDQIHQADRNLKYFCFQVEHLYEKRTLTFNMHQLLHLVENVNRHGPLWTHSCFYFEDFNGQLRRFFHGTQNVENQVLRTVSVIQSLPELAKKLDKGSEVELLYHGINGTKPVKRVIEQIDCEILAVGRMTDLDTSLAEIGDIKDCLQTEFPKFQGQVQQFQRISINGEMIHSAIYQRVEQRNSYTVLLKNEEFAQIQMFIHLSEGCLCGECDIYCNCSKHVYLAVILPLHKWNLVLVKDNLTGLAMKHTQAIKKADKSVIKVVNVNCIKEKVLYADYDEKTEFSFVTKFPNRIERD